MLSDVGPAAGGRVGRGRGGNAVSREILPRVVARDRREVPIGALQMLQEDVPRLDLAWRPRSAQRFQELLAVTRNGALNADDVDGARGIRRCPDSHLFR